MNTDLHMAKDLANTKGRNLFVVIGELDIDVIAAAGDDPETGQIRVRVSGVDIYYPRSGQVRSDNADGIAYWFIDTDYNEESFLYVTLTSLVLAILIKLSRKHSRSKSVGKHGSPFVALHRGRSKGQSLEGSW